jgi:hypothetical protein
MNPKECERQLVEYSQKLDPVLNPLGFAFEISMSGVSSPGPFATGFYVNGDKKIGLIYRSGFGFGSVIYEYHQTSVSHDGLMSYLGKTDVSKLSFDSDKFMSYSKNGGNALDALIYDIQNFEVGFLTKDNEQYGKVLKEISKTYNVPPDTHVMEGITIGMIAGSIIGYLLGSLGLGAFIGSVIGLVSGVLVDLREDKNLEDK